MAACLTIACAFESMWGDDGCRAARFCNGAAHGGQVVGPTSIVPGLLQAWGCETMPDGLGPASFIQVTAGCSRIKAETHPVCQPASQPASLPVTRYLACHRQASTLLG